MSTLQERLAIAMARRPDISPAAIARACRISGASVSAWINGPTQRLKADTARLAARLLGCDQNWLGEGVGTPDWDTDTRPESGHFTNKAVARESTATYNRPSIETALEVIGIALAASNPAMRDQLADEMCLWVRHGGKETHRAAVEATLLAPAQRLRKAGRA